MEQHNGAKIRFCLVVAKDDKSGPPLCLKRPVMSTVFISIIPFTGSTIANSYLPLLLNVSLFVSQHLTKD